MYLGLMNCSATRAFIRINYMVYNLCIQLQNLKIHVLDDFAFRFYETYTQKNKNLNPEQ